MKLIVFILSFAAGLALFWLGGGNFDHRGIDVVGAVIESILLGGLGVCACGIVETL